MSWDSSSRKPGPCRCPCLNSSFYVLCSTKYLQPAPVKEMNDRGLLLQPSSLGLAPLAISRRPACLSSTLVTYHSPGVGSPMNIYAEEPPPHTSTTFLESRRRQHLGHHSKVCDATFCSQREQHHIRLNIIVCCSGRSFYKVSLYSLLPSLSYTLLSPATALSCSCCPSFCLRRVWRR